MHKLFFLITPALFAIITNAQNVGIGTATPQAKLEVNGTLNSPAIPYTSSSGVFRLAGSANGGLDFGIHTVPWIQAGFGGVPADFSLQAMGGKVGIGTATPQYLLHMKSTDDAVHGIDAGATGAAWNYYLQNGTLRSAIGWSNINSALSFYVNGEDRMVINNNGHAGIGTTTPSYPLQFSNSDGDKLVLKYGGNPNNVTGLGTLGNNLVISGGDYFDQSNSIRLGYGSSGTGIASVLTVAPSPGKVGINNPNPGATLDVNGSVKITDGTQAPGAVLTSDVDGNASWKVPTAKDVSFKARINNGVAINSSATVIFDGLYFNNGNGYNPITGIFTAPSNGLYYFETRLGWFPTTQRYAQICALVLPNSAESVQCVGLNDPIDNYVNHTSVSTIVYLNTGQEVHVRAYQNSSGTVNLSSYVNDTHFLGYKIY